jgi:MFS family permease
MAIDLISKPPARGRANGMFRALSYRNYRLFWGGAFLSNIGTSMQTVAQALLMYDLTKSPFWLGLDGFMATIPGLFLTLAGGVLADVFDRRRLLVAAQVGSGLSALTLGILISTGTVQPWMILVLSFITGSCMSLAGPSYQALTVELVDRCDLSNAIALNSTQFQLSRVIGPMFAGVALKMFGVAGCFYLNAISYVAVVVALLSVRLLRSRATERPRPTSDRFSAFWQDLVAGLKYVWGRPRVFWLLMISAWTSLFGTPYLTMLPVFAHDVFHLGDSGFALMMGVAGGGAFLGALCLAFLGDLRRKGLLVLTASIAFGVFLVGFSLSNRIEIALIFLFGMGVSIVLSVAVINTLLQHLVTDQMRGRVMSMFILSFIGAAPFGNLAAGAASHTYGAPATLATGGLLITLFTLFISLKNRRLRMLS